jgi:multidrug resistance protein
MPGRTESANGPGAQADSGRRRRLVVVALMLTMALAAMDSSIVSTGVPQIVANLGGFTYFSWLFSGYLLTFTVTLPVYGRLSDSWGRKPVLLAGCALFLLGSLLCATAWSMASLVAFRMLQGLGGGAIQSTVQTIAADLYPPSQRGRIQSAISTVWAVSAVSGPAVGGVLVSYAGWRWIFLVNLPLGLVASGMLRRYLHEQVSTVAARIDWPGAAGILLTAGLLLVALVQGGTAWSWSSFPSATLFVGSALCGSLTVWFEQRAQDPILPGWIWRRGLMVGANLAMGCLGVLMIAPMVFLPTYAQSVLGLPPVAAGFVLSAMTLTWPVSAAFSPRLYRRIGFRDTALIGAAAATATLLAFRLLPYRGPAWQPTLVMLVLGAALGLVQLPLIVGVQSSVSWSERGTATASVLFCRQLGQCLGGAVFAAVANASLAGQGRAASYPSGNVPRMDDVTQVLRPGASPAPAVDAFRHALTTAVDHVYLGAALAAALAAVVLLAVVPRRSPVLPEE